MQKFAVLKQWVPQEKARFGDAVSLSEVNTGHLMGCRNRA